MAHGGISNGTHYSTVDAHCICTCILIQTVIQLTQTVKIDKTINLESSAIDMMHCTVYITLLANQIHSNSVSNVLYNIYIYSDCVLCIFTESIAC